MPEGFQALAVLLIIVNSKGGQSISLLHQRLELLSLSIPLPRQGFELAPQCFGFPLEGLDRRPELDAVRVELILPALLAGREPVPLGAEFLQLPSLCFDASRIAARELSLGLLQLDSGLLKLGPQLMLATSAVGHLRA